MSRPNPANLAVNARSINPAQLVINIFILTSQYNHTCIYIQGKYTSMAIFETLSASRGGGHSDPSVLITPGRHVIREDVRQLKETGITRRNKTSFLFPIWRRRWNQAADILDSTLCRRERKRTAALLEKLSRCGERPLFWSPRQAVPFTARGLSSF
jgi:hypothetical protein